MPREPASRVADRMIFRFAGRKAKRGRPTIAMLQMTLTPARSLGAFYRPLLRRRRILGLSSVREERPEKNPVDPVNPVSLLSE